MGRPGLEPGLVWGKSPVHHLLCVRPMNFLRSGTRDRTQILGFKGRCPTVRRSPKVSSILLVSPSCEYGSWRTRSHT